MSSFLDDIILDDEVTESSEVTPGTPDSDAGKSTSFFDSVLGTLENIYAPLAESGRAPLILPAGMRGPATIPLDADELVMELDQGVDVGQAIVRSVPDIVFALPELGAIGVDLAVGTRIAPNMRKYYDDAMRGIGLGVDTPAGEAMNALVLLGTGVIGASRYLSSVARAAKDTRYNNVFLKELKELGVSPSVLKQADDAILQGSRGATPFTGLGSTRKKVPFGTSILPMLISAEKLGKTKLAQKIYAPRPGRLNRIGSDVGKAAFGTGAVAAADFTLMPDGMHTLADSFDTLPNFMRTEDAINYGLEDSGFTPREEALRRLKNKIRFVGDGAIFGAAIEAAIRLGVPLTKAGVTGARKGSEIVAPPIKTGAKALDNATGRRISQGYGALMSNASDLRRSVSDIKAPFLDGVTIGEIAKRNLTTSRGLKNQFQKDILDVAGERRAVDINMAAQFALYEKETAKTVTLMSPLGSGKATNQQAYIDLEDFLVGNIDFKTLETTYGKTAANAAKRMRDQRDKFSKNLLYEIDLQVRDGTLDSTTATQIIAEFNKLDGKYLQRVFSGGVAREDMAKFKRTREHTAAVNEVEASLKINDPEFALLTPEAQRKAAEDFVERAIALERFEVPSAAKKDPKVLAKATEKIAKETGSEKPTGVAKKRLPLYTVNENFLKTRSAIINDSKTLREIMGEITAGSFNKVVNIPFVTRPDMKPVDVARVRIMNTIGEMSMTTSALNFYRRILDDPSFTSTYADVIRPGFNEVPYVIKDVPTTGGAGKSLEDAGYVLVPDATSTVYGGSFGSLSGTYIKPAFFNAITQATKGNSFKENAIASLVQAKGISQMNKTVYSPATQARNFNTFIQFLLANGNLLRGSNVDDAFSLALAKVSSYSDEEFSEFMQYLARSGAIDAGPILQEMEAMLGAVRSQLLDNPEKARRGILGLLDTSAESLKKVPGGKGLVEGTKTMMDTAERMYRFSDNLARIASILAERGKYTSALRNPLNDVLKFGFVQAEDFDLLAPILFEQGVFKRLGSPIIRPKAGEGAASRSLDNQRGASGLSLEQTREEIFSGSYRTDFDIAMGDIVADTTPNYGRTYKAAQDIAQFPLLGNFVAYPAENIRNVANITNRSIAEMGFKKTPELVQAMRQIAIKKEGQLRGLKGDALDTFIRRETAVPDIRLAEAEQLANKFVTEINAIGVRRATGALATIFMSGPVATKSLNQFSNANNEQQEATRELLANYAKGANIAITGRTEDGLVVEYINMSQNLAYDNMPVLGDSLRAALSKYKRGQGLGKSDMVSTRNAIIDYAVRNMLVFGQEAMLSEAILDVTVRGGIPNRGGQPIYDENSTTGEVLLNSMMHLAGSLEPTIIREFLEINGYGVREGAVVSAVKDQTFRSGAKTTPVEQFVKLVLGISPGKLNVPLVMAYETSSYRRKESRIRTGMYDALRISRPSDSIEDFKNDVRDAQEKYFRSQQELYRKLTAAAKLGMTKEDFYEAADIQNVTLSEDEYANLTQGKFTPLKINYNRLTKFEEENEFYNLNRAITADELEQAIEDLNEESENLRDLTLIEEFSEPKNKNNIFGSFSDTPSSVAFEDTTPETSNVPVLSQALSSPSAPPVDSLSTATGPETSSNPELYGDNVIEQARNMELARRLGKA